MLQKQLPVLRAKYKREIDTTGAYIDRLILNVYAGPGVSEVWIDDLDIGPCIPEAVKPKTSGDADLAQFHRTVSPLLRRVRGIGYASTASRSSCGRSAGPTAR